MKAHCTLVDYDKKSCVRANLIFKKFSKNKFKIIKSDIFKYKDNKKYDFVVSNGVAHHTKSSSKVLNIACSKVKKNGFIIYGIANQSGMFQRNLMRLILFSISKNNNDIMRFAKVLFKDSIDRSIKFSGRSAEEIISDTFINPKFSAVKPLDILNTFKKYNIDLYSSFPDLKDIETFINTEHMQFKLTNNKSKKLFNKNSIHLHDFQSLSLNKNKNNKDVIKKIKKINQLKDLLVEKINDKNFNNYKIDIQKYLLNLNKFKKESKEFKKINIFDKKHNDEFIDEVKKVLNIMLEKKENEIKIKMLKKTIHKMKLLFKGYNGVGMNYYVGYRIK